MRAKAEGRQSSGLDPSTAALFRDGFQVSPLGEIPVGWHVGRVSDLMRLSRDALLPDSRPDELFDHYSIPAFDEGRVPRIEAGQDIKSSKLTVPPLSVLLSKLNPHIPRVWLPSITGDRTAVCSTEFLVLNPIEGETTREYLFGLLTSKGFQETFASLVTGTTGSHQRVRPESFLAMQVPVAPKSVIRHYTELSAPLHSQVSTNLAESSTLAAIRDALLPKLLSGQIRVKEAEWVVAEVV
jgi:type I restriction enzyme S subunit